jgi:ubiquinone/menaquinone biosynthesis C-methylase UbiE
MAAQAYGYLIHRAQFGTADLHPFGAPATGVLIHALQLAPDQRVLEIGCGTATTLVRIAAAVPLAIDGVDLLPAMLAVARRRIRLAGVYRRARLVRANASAGLPFANAAYERVYTESVLGLASAEQAQTFLREIFRVLKPGGRYIANEAIWKPGVDAATAAALHAAELRDFGVGQASPQSWSLSDWTAAMSTAGFAIEATPQLTPEFLAEHAARHPAPRRSLRAAQALARARLVTWGYRGLSSLRAEHRRAQQIYRRHEQAHQEDGRALEGRLFVLVKPE